MIYIWFTVPLIAIIGIIYCLVKVAKQDSKVRESMADSNKNDKNNNSIDNKPDNTPNLPPQY